MGPSLWILPFFDTKALLKVFDKTAFVKCKITKRKPHPRVWILKIY
jgi:hypothetical protein